MKKIALTAIIVASLSTGAAVAGEPFKNRGIDYVNTVQTDTRLPREAVTVQIDRFKNGGFDYRDVVSVSDSTPRAEINPMVKGFNNRGDVAFTHERQDMSKVDKAHVGYSR